MAPAYLAPRGARKGERLSAFGYGRPMETVSPHEVDAALERYGAGSAVVAFDCDGTLWSGDVGDDLFHAACERRLFRAPAVDGIRRDARAHGLESEGPVEEVARRVLDAGKAGTFPEEHLYELMTWALAGLTRGEVRRLCSEVLSERAIEQRLHGETFRVLVSALRRGLDLVAVSASPRPVVEVALERLAIPARAVCAATPLWDGDVMAPDVERPIPYGAGKVTALRGAVGDTPVAVALGDSGFDVDLLRAAAIPLAVHPKPALVAAADRVPGLRLLVARL